MMKHLNILTAIFTMVLCSETRAQDYYDDINGNSNPISQGDKGYYLGFRTNVGDNSIKLNLFRFYPVSDTEKEKTLIGWGAHVKGKTEDGFGSLFSSSSFSPGFQTGAYGAYQKLYKGEASKYWTCVAYVNYGVSNAQVFDSTRSFKAQLYDTALSAASFGASFFYVIPVGKEKKANLIPAISVDFSKKSNYGSMNKIDVRSRREITDPSSGKTYAYNDINDNGYSYGNGIYKVSNVTQVRLSCAWIPAQTNYRVALIPYGSVRFKNDKQSLSCGFGLHFLEKGNPTATIAGISFEFADINNTADSDDNFIKRAFTISLSAALSTFTLK